MKKSTQYRLWMIAIQLMPIILAVIYCAPDILQKTEKWLSIASLFVIIVLICIFKDAAKRYIQTPSGFKISIFVAILSGFCMLVGEQLFILSCAAILGGLLALPLNILYTNEIRPPTNKEMEDKLNEIKEKIENE